MDSNSYRWKKFKNGRGNVAIVNIDVEKISSDKSEIIEKYSGQGFTGQGHIESIPMTGMDAFKLAARHGLEYGFSFTKDNWRVTINEIQCRPILDSNPTVIGYTIFRAFCHKADIHIDDSKIEELENFLLTTWTNPYKDLIPNFFTRTFYEYNYDK
jgi:hypothetical protein